MGNPAVVAADGVVIVAVCARVLTRSITRATAESRGASTKGNRSRCRRTCVSARRDAELKQPRKKLARRIRKSYRLWCACARDTREPSSTDRSGGYLKFAGGRSDTPSSFARFNLIYHPHRTFGRNQSHETSRRAIK